MYCTWFLQDLCKSQAPAALVRVPAAVSHFGDGVGGEPDAAVRRGQQVANRAPGQRHLGQGHRAAGVQLRQEQPGRHQHLHQGAVQQAIQKSMLFFCCSFRANVTVPVSWAMGITTGPVKKQSELYHGKGFHRYFISRVIPRSDHESNFILFSDIVPHFYLEVMNNSA